MIIETTNKLIEKVKTAFPQGLLKKVDALPGRLDDAMLQRFLVNQPAVYFAFIGGRGRGDSSMASIDARWVAYVVTDVNDSARHPGPDDIINVLAPMLHQFTIEGVGSLRLTAIDNLFTMEKDRKAVRVHALTFVIPKFSFDYTPDLSGLANFITFHAEHSMAAGADEPDAIDEITLEQ